MKDITMQSVIGTRPLPMPKPTSNKLADTGFGDLLNKSIEAVNKNTQEADKLVEGLVSGQHAKIHETMIALEKANITFRLMTKFQGKVLEAYKEVMRMQL